MPTPFSRAIVIWRTGNSLPADLTAILTSLGYNVGAMEERHLNS